MPDRKIPDLKIKKSLKKLRDRFFGDKNRADEGSARQGRDSTSSLGLMFAAPSPVSDRPNRTPSPALAGPSVQQPLPPGMAPQADIKGKRFAKTMGAPSERRAPSKSLDQMSISSVMSTESLARRPPVPTGPLSESPRAQSPASVGSAAPAQSAPTSMPDVKRFRAGLEAVRRTQSEHNNAEQLKSMPKIDPALVSKRLAEMPSKGREIEERHKASRPGPSTASPAGTVTRPAAPAATTSSQQRSFRPLPAIPVASQAGATQASGSKGKGKETPSSSSSQSAKSKSRDGSPSVG